MVHSYVLGLAIGIPITAVLTSVISFIIVYKRRKGALLVTRTDGIDNEYVLIQMLCKYFIAIVL
jgi:hypothetical protein